MRTYVLIPGAGGVAWYWHRVVPLLQQAGHDVVAVDLPGDDEKAGLREYADVVIDAMDGRTDVVLVAQSLGGFTAPLVAAGAPVQGIVLVNAMIPVPGETPEEWGENTGAGPARIAAAGKGGYGTEFDPVVYFLHDLPPDVAAESEGHQRDEAGVVFRAACLFDGWPDVPISVVAGADDRLFPADFQVAAARDRLGLEPTILPGGHLMALAQPAALADHLLSL